MLLDFTIENFRSIKDEAVLSAVAHDHMRRARPSESQRKYIKSDKEIASPYTLENRKIGLLPVLGIFGANASGKTNILKALDFLMSFMAYPGQNQPNQNRIALFFTPFLLHSEKIKTPSRFILRAVRSKNIYTYTLVLDSQRILQETLEYIPSSSKRMQNRLLFSRIWEEGTKLYQVKNGPDFGNTYKKFQLSLRENTTFMSFLVHDFDVKSVEPFTSWLRFHWSGIDFNNEDIDRDYAGFLLKEDSPKMLKSVINLVKLFDVGIHDIEIEKVESDENEEEFDVLVWHKTDTKPIKWPMWERESLGTRRLFNLAVKMLESFRFGKLLLIDEFGSDLHPNISHTIIRLFQNKLFNPQNAQLVFTSHDNTLQQKNLLRRDQIWFTQKRKDGSTELYPLSDFSPRSDLAIDKAYLDGRFGAVPVLPNDEELIKI